MTDNHIKKRSFQFMEGRMQGQIISNVGKLSPVNRLSPSLKRGVYSSFLIIIWGMKGCLCVKYEGSLLRIAIVSPLIEKREIFSR
jgi:hypothetical protein